MHANAVSRQIIAAGKALRACGTHKATLPLMLNNLMFRKGILPRERFSTARMLARKASRAVDSMHLGYVALELAATTKGTRAERA